MNELKRFLVPNVKPVDCDLEKRIVRNCCFATTGLASDGWIVLPSGMELGRYNAQPIVTSRHVQLPGGDAPVIQDNDPIVIGRSLSLAVADLDLTSEVQFADTRAGYEYGYLYGLNPDKTPFARAWSIEGPVLEKRSATWSEARTLSAQYWDEALAERMRAAKVTPMVATRYELANVAAVALGADRNALTRAAGAGIGAAQEWLARLDLEASRTELETLKRELSENCARVARLERELKALSAEVASAGKQRNTEAVLAEVRDLTRKLSGRVR